MCTIQMKPEHHQIHPLLINHVVERIFTNLSEESPKTLLELRTVCKTWNQVGTEMHLKHSLYFIPFGKFSHFHSISATQEISNLHKSSLNGFPFGNYKFCEDMFQQNNQAQLRIFFMDCSTILTRLVLRFDPQSNISVPPEWIPSTTTFPRIKSLTIDDKRTTSDAFDNVFSTILKASSNSLETLSIVRKQIEMGLPIVYEADEHGKMMGRLCASFSQVTLLKLKYFHLELKVDDTFLLCLSQRMRCLEKLNLCLKNSQFHKESLYKLLLSQEGTLKSLKIASLCGKSNFIVKFPKWKQLQSIEIHGWSDTFQGVEFDQFTIPQNFATLKQIVFHTWCEQESWMQFLRSETRNAVERLKLAESIVNPEIIVGIGEGFGHLKSLILHYNPSPATKRVFELIFEHFKQLEELKVLHSYCEFHKFYNIDELMTGIPGKECKRMLKINNFSWDEENPKGLKSLKRLRKLDLSDVLRYQAAITDVTGYYILSMANLKHLKITASNIQQNCFLQLNKKFSVDLDAQMGESRKSSKSTEPEGWIPIKNCAIY